MADEPDPHEVGKLLMAIMRVAVDADAGQLQAASDYLAARGEEPSAHICAMLASVSLDRRHQVAAAVVRKFGIKRG